jgi:hypothetical protein
MNFEKAGSVDTENRACAPALCSAHRRWPFLYTPKDDVVQDKTMLPMKSTPKPSQIPDVILMRPS